MLNVVRTHHTSSWGCRLAPAAALILAITCAAASGACWPDYRGPTFDGHAPADADPPLHWSEQQNVRWKTPIHGRGWSSPVIWGRYLWLTTAPENGQELFAVGVDVETGEIRRDVRLFTVAEPGDRNPLNSYASPSPVIEEGRVYVHFGSNGTACLNSDSGEVLWRREDLHCAHGVGPGSSPLLLDNLLILTYDGMDVQFVVALDKRTGNTVWQSPRSTDFSGIIPDQRKAFGTAVPAVLDGRAVIFSVGPHAAMAYAPEDGRELWRFRFRGYSASARPVFKNDLAFVNTGFGRSDLLALRLIGSGDVTGQEPVWEQRRNVQARSSPLLVDDLLYILNSGAHLLCLEAATGALQWSEKLGRQASASPVYAGGRIYCADHEGQMTVVAPGRQFKALSKNRLDDGCMASFAVLGKALIIRTRTHLYRIQES